MEHVIFTSQGVRCSAWFFPAPTNPAPCVVIAHGFDGVREQRLDAYAERFAAGMAALVFDYRYSGSARASRASCSTTRPSSQDWRAAIACARESSTEWTASASRCGGRRPPAATW